MYTGTGCLLALVAVHAYFRAFSFLSANHDEGYILQSIRSYLEGRRLFEELFSRYGPAFYLFESFIHRVLHVPLTHDFERFVTMAVWVGASAASAATVLRLTRSSLAAGLTLIGVFFHLMPLINEPGHPQGPLVLAIALVALTAAWDRGEAPSPARATAAGALTAFALLVKVNVGAYVALGFALPLLLSARLPPTRVNRALVATATTAACVLPLVVMRSHVRGWALNYALVTSLSLVATVLAVVWPRRPSVPFGVVVRFALAACVSAVLVLTPQLIRGTSASALLKGIILRPSQFVDLFQIPLPLPKAGLLTAIAGSATSLAYVLSVRLGHPPRALVVAGAKLAAAAGGLYLSHLGYISQIAYFTPFLWVVAVPSDDNSTFGGTIGRAILGLLAVYQSLQAYPVAGSQLSFATFLMVPVAFVCAHDAVAILERRFAAARGLSLALQASMLVTGILLYRQVVNPRPWRATYAAGYELRLRGAERLRLPRADVARYHWLTATVGANCSFLLTMPGLYSLNAWANVAPVNGLNIGTWMTLLTAAEQATVWRDVDRLDRVCAIYSPTIAANWVGSTSLETLSAYRQMATRFHPIAEADGYRLLMRARDVQSSSALMALVAGRQAFEKGRSPLPILPDFPVGRPASTLRTWVKSTRTGVIVGCQTQEHAGIHSWRWLPMLYIGNTGKLYGQHWTASMHVQVTRRPVNDGSWHHVALVRDQNDQRLFVDGDLVGLWSSNIETAGLEMCQVGTGATSLWPDGTRGWMPFNGEIEGLGVSLRAWSAREVSDDWRQTQPRDQGPDRN